MRKLLSVGTVGLASLVAVGLLSLQGGSANAKDDSVSQDPVKVVKRDEDTPDVIMDDDFDDGDDDTGAIQQTRTRTRGADEADDPATNGVDTSVDDSAVDVGGHHQRGKDAEDSDNSGPGKADDADDNTNVDDTNADDTNLDDTNADDTNLDDTNLDDTNLDDDDNGGDDNGDDDGGGNSGKGSGN